jgi:hypothetical protein
LIPRASCQKRVQWKALLKDLSITLRASKGLGNALVWMRKSAGEENAFVADSSFKRIGERVQR